MPRKASRPCAHPRCPELVTEGSRCPAHDKAAWQARNERPEIREDKRFYDSARWQQLRAFVLREEPWCRECRRNNRVSPATVVDHIQRIRDGGSRTNLTNLQPLCDRCHDKKRGKESWQ
jgi:5-methylcytosine-specific restriction protein A